MNVFNAVLIAPHVMIQAAMCVKMGTDFWMVNVRLVQKNVYHVTFMAIVINVLMELTQLDLSVFHATICIVKHVIQEFVRFAKMDIIWMMTIHVLHAQFRIVIYVLCKMNVLNAAMVTMVYVGMNVYRPVVLKVSLLQQICKVILKVPSNQHSCKLIQ